jgi:hypothetical protein
MSTLFFVKVLVSAMIIAAAAVVAKRSPFWDAILIALPLTLAFLNRLRGLSPQKPRPNKKAPLGAFLFGWRALEDSNL